MSSGAGMATGRSAAVRTGPPAIELRDVTKIYRRYNKHHFATLKSALLQRSLVRDLRPADVFPALKGVSFSVRAGGTYGVIGRNGSGKSTALKLVAGISKPTSGTVSVTGRISALIELGAGFHPEITGRENVFINGIMLGLTRREIERRFDEIVDFAELREFIDAPVKTYSSGMYMRLGFAVATHVDPDVLLVDEVLAVGDEAFTHKCLDQFAEFKRRGKTILLVTHSLPLVEKLCDEALWLDAGEKRAEGEPPRVIGAYMADVDRQEDAQIGAADAKAREDVAAEPAPAEPPPTDPEHPDMFRAGEGRWGAGGVEIAAVTIADAAGAPTHIFQAGAPMTISLSVRAARRVDDFVFGIGIFSADGVCVYGTNTAIEGFAPRALEGDATVAFQIDELDLVEGTYKLDVAVHKQDGAPYDYHRLLYTFRVKSPCKDVGLYRPDHRWRFSENVRMSASDAPSTERQ